MVSVLISDRGRSVDAGGKTGNKRVTMTEEYPRRAKSDCKLGARQRDRRNGDMVDVSPARLGVG
jgi:hypothetical protein